MAKLLHFLLPTILTAVTLPASASVRTGLTLNLINCFLLQSPFYSGNLTESQLPRKLIQQFRTRVPYIKHLICMHTDRSNTTIIRPPVARGPSSRSGIYIVSISVGTENAKQSYYLSMDAGSRLTWTQCIPCDPCYPQSSPIFNPQLSPSFIFLPCNDLLCAEPYGCHDERCTFSISYIDDSSITGVISRDAFSFETSTGNPEIVQGLAFGCTHQHSGLVDLNGDVHGIIGLDASPESFITQLGPRASGRFSYCLLPYTVTANNYLRFGDGIMMNVPVQRTPSEIRYGFYYLGMNDLSVEGHLP